MRGEEAGAAHAILSRRCRIRSPPRRSPLRCLPGRSDGTGTMATASPAWSPAGDRALPIQLTPLVARCRRAAKQTGGLSEESGGLEALLEGQPMGGRPPELPTSPRGAMRSPAGLAALVTSPARRAHGTCRLLLSASTAMKRHGGFCQKTKRQRQSWGWGKLSAAAQEDPCGGSRMLTGCTAATHPREHPPWHPLARRREDGGWAGLGPLPEDVWGGKCCRTQARPRTTAGHKGKIPPGWLRFAKPRVFPTSG